MSLVRVCHPWRLPLLILSPLLLWVGANVSGFCFSQGRWLSDQELTDAYIDEFTPDAKPYPAQLQSWRREAGDLETIKIRSVLPYNSIEQFKAINPDCCRIGRTPRGRNSLLPMSWWDRFSGYAYTMISAVYVWRYVGEDGMERSVPLQSQSWINSCGRPKAPLGWWDRSSDIR